MKYRGFNLVYTFEEKLSGMNPRNHVWGQFPGYTCQVFSETDDGMDRPLDTFHLILGDPLRSLDQDELEEWMVREADKSIDNWHRAEAEDKVERKNELIGRLVCYLGESEQGRDLYNTLHDEIGMTDNEIHECGFDSLAEYFDRPAYAQTIAEWLIRTGTENTSSGNWIIGFDEVTERFGVDLSTDDELLDAVSDCLNRSEAILDFYTDNEEFDINFGLRYCPFAEDLDLNM